MQNFSKINSQKYKLWKPHYFSCHPVYLKFSNNVWFKNKETWPFTIPSLLLECKSLAITGTLSMVYFHRNITKLNVPTKALLFTECTNARHVSLSFKHWSTEMVSANVLKAQVVTATVHLQVVVNFKLGQTGLSVVIQQDLHHIHGKWL